MLSQDLDFCLYLCYYMPMFEKTGFEKSLLANRIVADKRAARSLAIITLRIPDDPIRADQLRIKQEAYRARRDEYDGTPPMHERAKSFLLDLALSGTEPTVAEAWDEFIASDKLTVSERYTHPPEIVLSEWVDASRVIIDYLTTGGQNVNGGGLPNLE